MAEEQIDDRRAAIEAAIDKAESEETPPVETDPPAEEVPAEEPPAPATDGTPPEPETEVETPPAEPVAETEPVAAVPPEPVAESAATEIAAPVGWRGGAKQHWEKLPNEVKAEVDKREREIGGALREAAEARQFQTQFDQVIDPFKSIIASRGVHPLQATQAMLQTHATLTMGTPAQKAQTIAKAIQEYGVDIEALANAIDGQPGEGAPGNGSGGVDPAMQQWLEQQLAPVRQFAATMQQSQAQQTQQTQREVATELDAFEADPQNVFYADVREVMGDILEVAGKQGRPMSFQDAYNTAVMMNPELAKQHQARQALENVPAGQTAAQRRAAAASSIAPRAQPVSMPEPKDRREAIEQAITKLEGSAA